MSIRSLTIEKQIFIINLTSPYINVDTLLKTPTPILAMHYVLSTYNLRLSYVEMLESVCLALESGVHGINM